MNEFFPLSLWLKGRESLKKFIDTNEVKLCFQLGSFISLDRHYYIHNIEKASAQSLSISWDKTNEYIKKHYHLLMQIMMMY